MPIKARLQKEGLLKKTIRLYKECCEVGKEIAQARKQFLIDKETLKKFPFESSKRMRSLCLQQDMIAKKLVDFSDSQIDFVSFHKST